MPADINSGLYSMPPLVLSQDITQSYWQWSGYIPPGSVSIAPPTSPSDLSDETPPVFKASTNELDKYRALFLVIGVVIGAMLLGKR